MVRYPHTLHYTLAGADSTQDANGTWTTPAPPAPQQLSCRGQPVSHKLEFTQDGEYRRFSFSVYTPPRCPDLPVGLEVELRGQNGETLYQGQIQRFFRLQMGVVQLWL